MNLRDVDHGDMARDVEALERAWMDAWVNRNTETCRNILDDSFILTSASGVLLDKTQWLEKAAGAFSATEFTWLSITVRKIADTVAVAHLKSSQVASIGDKNWSGVFLMTDVWVKRADGWKVIARQGLGPLPSGQIPVA